MVDHIVETNIMAGCHKDHSLIEMKIVCEHFKQGPGIWRLNNQLLKEQEFEKGVISCMNEVSADKENLYGYIVQYTDQAILCTKQAI